MKALEVLRDGKFFCLCVPAVGGAFSAVLGNIPRTYMRAFVVSMNDSEERRWQLPDVAEGTTIAFRMIEVADHIKGREPSEISARDPKEVARVKARAKRMRKQFLADSKLKSKSEPNAKPRPKPRKTKG